MYTLSACALPFLAEEFLWQCPTGIRLRLAHFALFIKQAADGWAVQKLLARVRGRLMVRV